MLPSKFDSSFAFILNS